MTEILSPFIKYLITHFACNIYLYYWHFKKTGVKTLTTCCKAAMDQHDKHYSMKILQTFYYSMHLRHFEFSENCFIIDLKSIAFRMSFLDSNCLRLFVCKVPVLYKNRVSEFRSRPMKCLRCSHSIKRSS